ncbi:MAG TPA: hypothetical protein VNQ14_01430 [Woeseiaceae bacterium]|nr:hypothetical protein [Woeseiaceae bacterium]
MTKPVGTPQGGCFGVLVVSVLVAAVVAFALGKTLWAFFIVALGCFLMLSAGVAILVIMNNRQEDEAETVRRSQHHES